MPIPRLIHPVNIVIRQTVPASTAYDEDAREPIQRVSEGAQVTVPGQPNFRGVGKGIRIQSYTAGGVDEEVFAYILFRYLDLNALAIDLKPNDRIVQIGHLAMDAYICYLMPSGHYPDTNGPSLVKAYFKDRAPARQSPGAV